MYLLRMRIASMSFHTMKINNNFIISRAFKFHQLSQVVMYRCFSQPSPSPGLSAAFLRGFFVVCLFLCCFLEGLTFVLFCPFLTEFLNFLEFRPFCTVSNILGLSECFLRASWCLFTLHLLINWKLGLTAWIDSG